MIPENFMKEIGIDIILFSLYILTTTAQYGRNRCHAPIPKLRIIKKYKEAMV
jgi:hypothetical protein